MAGVEMIVLLFYWFGFFLNEEYYHLTMKKVENIKNMKRRRKKQEEQRIQKRQEEIKKIEMPIKPNAKTTYILAFVMFGSWGLLIWT